MKMLIFCRFIVTVVEKKSLAAFIVPAILLTHRNNVSFSAMLPLELTLFVALNLTFGLAASGTTRLKISPCIKTEFEFLQNDIDFIPKLFLFHDLSVIINLYKNFILAQKPPLMHDQNTDTTRNSPAKYRT